MGKIFDAIEKSKQEKAIRVEPLIIGREHPTPARELMPRGRYNPKLVVLSGEGSIEEENFKLLRSGGGLSWSQACSPVRAKPLWPRTWL
jgi:hypothetical protein